MTGDLSRGGLQPTPGGTDEATPGPMAALERVMHVERSARCMAIGMKRHPGVRQDPDLGGCLDARVRGHDHDAARAVC